MNLMHHIVKIIWLFSIITFGLGNTLSLQDNVEGTWNVNYESNSAIKSFEFVVDGSDVTSAGGGDAGTFEYTIEWGGAIVTGVRENVPYIPSGSGILIVLELTVAPAGLSGIVISDANGVDINFTFSGCMDDGNCTVETCGYVSPDGMAACNYNANATTNNSSCLYPCSSSGGCDEIDSNYDCNGICIVGVDCAGECGGPITAAESCTGCRDDGYKDWSPNLGSPACNYAPFAKIEEECKYNDCRYDNENFTQEASDLLDYCGGTVVVDCEGECGGDNSTCEDCNYTPNGSAYINACGDCVGGDSGMLDDCFILKKEYENLYYSDSVYTIQVFADSLDTLQSIDIEFQYDVNLLEITGFSLYGTALGNQDYEISYYNTIVEEPYLMETKSTIYFNPPDSTDTPIVFSPNERENIFNIQLETKSILTDSVTAEITINTISLNENSIYIGIWGEWTILLTPLQGCTDSDACNYNPLATYNDGCWTPSEGCTCSDGEGALPNECDECEIPETGNVDCSCGEDNNRQLDCNGDCPPDECTGEFFVEGCAIRDECNVCVGGATERYPCEQDCVAILLSTEEWGGIAYEDNCGVCISNTVETIIPEVLDSLDCFNSSFSIFNSNGIEFNDLIVKESDTIYVALQMQNLPDSLEGLILNIDYNSNDLFLKNWSLRPDSTINLFGEPPGELNNSNELYINIDSTFIDSTIFKAVIYTKNEPYQGHGGNILFLQFLNIGINGDSTYVKYNKVQVNEHVMKEQNYTSQVIYFGDCYGVFNGETPLDECGECGGSGVMQACGCGSPGEFGIPDGDCDCEGNTPADLYGGEGYNCEGILSLNENLIPQSFTLSQNYPNPFNPITYIQYSIPYYDFITIDIINISGQIINTIVQSSHQPGNYEIMWDSTNHSGISVPSGIYFYKMNASNFISVRKLVLLK